MKRKPKVVDGELAMYYGKLTRYESPDVIYDRGNGVSKRDAHLLHKFLGSPRMRFVFGDEAVRAGRGYDFGPSLFEELTDRGYDITTLRFSIKKLPEPAKNPVGSHEESTV